MAKEKFERLLYVGPVSSFSVVTPNLDEAKNTDASIKSGVVHFEIESDDRPLITGVTYDDLPMDHPVIQNLIAAKLLIPAPPEASPDPAVSDSTNTKAGDDRSTSISASQKGKSK